MLALTRGIVARNSTLVEGITATENGILMVGLLWCAIIGTSIALVALHRFTGGRSSPIAAFSFVLAGPALGAVLLIPPVLKNISYRSANLPPREPETIYGATIVEYCLYMGGVGLAVAMIAASVCGLSIRNELLHIRGDRFSASPRPVASAALHALGLSAFATLEEVEIAYQSRAVQLDPDRREDAISLKMLQRHYERAKALVSRQRGC